MGKIPKIISDYMRRIGKKGMEAMRGTEAMRERNRKVARARWAKEIPKKGRKMKTVCALFFTIILSVSAFSEGQWHIKSDCVATKNKADMEMPLQMIVDKDFHALAEFIMDGNGIMLSPKNKIFVVKQEDWGTNLEIRVSGSSKLWWISVDSLEVPEE